ncbi:MAG: 4Fe-4S binding protein, partial [Candidatus Thermoplasmatota archaeon]|nr:4Fe-4S binding protein [Candidatus Thermoplasmatota archaeon]
LFLVDGIIGMDGKGPAQGDPRKVGAMISGTDPLAIDLHVSRMVGLRSDNIPILRAAFGQERISEDERIDVSGSGKGIYLKDKFKPSSGGITSVLTPRPVRRAVIGLTTRKPKISHKRCVGCGVCKANCAGDAITIKNGKARIDNSKCIRCYCCHELCPHDAVYLSARETGFLDRVIDIFYHITT